MNRRDAEDARDAFTMKLFNDRGVHTWTAGREERELAETARQKAEALQLPGFLRFAAQMRTHSERLKADAGKEAKHDPWDLP